MVGEKAQNISKIRKSKIVGFDLKQEVSGKGLSGKTEVRVPLATARNEDISKERDVTESNANVEGNANEDIGANFHKGSPPPPKKKHHQRWRI